MVWRAHPLGRSGHCRDLRRYRAARYGHRHSFSSGNKTRPFQQPVADRLSRCLYDDGIFFLRRRNAWTCCVGHDFVRRLRCRDGFDRCAYRHQSQGLAGIRHHHAALPVAVHRYDVLDRPRFGEERFRQRCARCAAQFIQPAGAGFHQYLDLFRHRMGDVSLLLSVRLPLHCGRIARNGFVVGRSRADDRRVANHRSAQDHAADVAAGNRSFGAADFYSCGRDLYDSGNAWLGLRLHDTSLENL